MITAKLIKIEITGYRCQNSTCEFNPKIHDRFFDNSNFYIKKDTTCAVISMLGVYADKVQAIYCRQCIDSIYNQLKPVLDSKLWHLL